MFTPSPCQQTPHEVGKGEGKARWDAAGSRHPTSSMTPPLTVQDDAKQLAVVVPRLAAVAQRGRGAGIQVAEVHLLRRPRREGDSGVRGKGGRNATGEGYRWESSRR